MAVPEIHERVSDRARRLRVIVRPDAPVEVVIPRGVRRRDVDRFVADRLDWIERASERLAQRAAREPVLGLDRPGVAWLMGDAVPVDLVEGERSTARLVRGRLRVCTADGDAVAPIERWYRREARRLIEAVVARRGAELGLAPARVAVRDTRSRWGSCSSRGTLSFSWRLAVTPPAVLDYVVVHELCHLRRLDHSRAFWRLVDEACPEHAEHQRWLREHGSEVMAYAPRPQRV